jgi:hypothetical protein
VEEVRACSEHLRRHGVGREKQGEVVDTTERQREKGKRNRNTSHKNKRQEMGKRRSRRKQW